MQVQVHKLFTAVTALEAARTELEGEFRRRSKLETVSFREDRRRLERQVLKESLMDVNPWELDAPSPFLPLRQITELKSWLGDSEAQRETLQAEMSSLQSRHTAEVTSLQSQCSAMQAKCAGLQDQGRSSIDILNGPGPGTTSVLRKRQVWTFLTKS